VKAVQVRETTDEELKIDQPHFSNFTATTIAIDQEFNSTVFFIPPSIDDTLLKKKTERYPT
jgi:hypothetical protein